jgi:ectoine hydroxylase-related dioxygenase (phytanoyl-CoA dioxygenase family)
MKFGVQSLKFQRSDFFAEQGFEILTDILSDDECDALLRDLSRIYDYEQKSAENRIGGVRNILRQSKAVATFASSEKIKNLLSERLASRPFPVRAIFFDKSPQSNWHVPWHQDLAIAVKQKIESEGFRAWSIKDDVLHVQPPREILEGMATIRIHLDDCDSENGALKVVPGSHAGGKLTAPEIAVWTKINPVVCEVKRGSALLMRPLLLHSSSPARTPSHRRVLHVEYATQNLPNGLEWFEA